MLEILIGFIILIIPYLVGSVLNILAYGFDFKHWEGIGLTYVGGILILVILCSVVFVLYYTGHYAMLIIN